MSFTGPLCKTKPLASLSFITNITNVQKIVDFLRRHLEGLLDRVHYNPLKMGIDERRVWIIRMVNKALCDGYELEY